MTLARKAASLLLLISLIAFGGCGDNGAKPTPTSASNLRIGATVPPNALDPTTNNLAAIPQALLYNVYETLVKLDAEGTIRPLLAKEWSVSADGLTYTFTLRDGATFTSGAPVNAAAVVASIQRIQNDPAVTSVNKTQMAVVSAATAKDDKTVVVTLARPSNGWLYNMTGSAGIVLDPAHLADLATKPVGSGPYTVKTWNEGDSLVLARNPHYWGLAAAFDTVTFRYYTDPNAENAAMLAGDLDIISDVTAPQALNQFSDASRYQVIKGTSNGEIVLGLNNANAALSDVRVRQAICYAIDRQALMDSVWAGEGLLIGSMVPPTDPWFQDLSDAYPFNPALAKTLLAQAGFGEGLTLRLRVPTIPYATGSETFIVSQLKDIGITVQVDELDPTRWADEVYTQGNYDMTIIAHVEPRDIAKWADPTYYWHYSNTTFQGLIAQADESPADQYIPLMQQAAKLLSDDAAGDFLWLLPSIIVATPNLTGIPQNKIALSFDLSAIASRTG